jgi:Holliday junction resolvase RusA-like endonuclease
MIELKLLGDPKSTNHIYKSVCRGRFASVYMSTDGKNLKESYKWQIKSQYRGHCLSENLKLNVKLFFGNKRIRDIDNYNKIVLDACSGLIWTDDSQIQEITISKFYDKGNPRIELLVELF